MEKSADAKESKLSQVLALIKGLSPDEMRDCLIELEKRVEESDDSDAPEKPEEAEPKEISLEDLKDLPPPPDMPMMQSLSLGEDK